MPNIGFWAVAGAGGGAAVPAFDLLETIDVYAYATTLTFSSLSTYASTYKHLQIRYTMRDATSGSESYIKVSFNGDTATNYSYHNLRAIGSSVTSGSGTNQSFMYLGMCANNNSAGVWAGGIIDINNAFSSDVYKTARSLSGFIGPSYNGIALYSGLWRNTAALNRIDISVLTPYIIPNTRVSLYGIKG